MPLARISLRQGKPAEYRRLLLEGLYQALRETFGVPEDDRFMTISEHDDDDFGYGASYLGIDRSPDLVIVQLTVSRGRTIAQKKALYRAIVDRLVDRPGLRPQDIFINLLEVERENWSFGHGIAQYAQSPA